MGEPAIRLIVFAPDFFGAAFIDPAALQVMDLWRDDRLRPVVNRALLLRYFRVFRALGLSDSLVRRWAWWLTSPHKTRFVAEDAEPVQTAQGLCIQLAQRSNAEVVVHSGRVFSPQDLNLDPSGPVRWMFPDELLQQLATGDLKKAGA